MKLWQIRLITVWGVLFMALFAYGVINFPDAPIGPCHINQFCGKLGAIHTIKEYRAYSIWENTFIISLVVTWVPVICLNIWWRFRA